MQYIKPPRLKKGDKVGLVSPSNSIKHRKDEYLASKNALEKALDIEIVPAKNTFKEMYYSAGTADERANDINQMFADPEIKAIFFSIGGQTAIDLLDKLDYELIKKNPKIVCGISDATTLLNPITAKTGLITYLGMEYFAHGKQDMKYEYEYMKKAWFKGKIDDIKPDPNWKNFDGLKTDYKQWQTIKAGQAKGRIVGGSYGGFSCIFNTEYGMELKNNILILETYLQAKRQIHRHLMNLRLHRVFDKISGLIIGYCTGSDNPDVPGNERPLKDVVLEVSKGYNFPIMQVGEIGHNVENIILPIGAKAHIDSEKLKFTILEDTVL